MVYRWYIHGAADGLSCIHDDMVYNDYCYFGSLADGVEWQTTSSSRLIIITIIKGMLLVGSETSQAGAVTEKLPRASCSNIDNTMEACVHNNKPITSIVAINK